MSVTLLVVLAVQILGSMAFVSVCPEPCPDDAEGTSCPPICALCTTCTHAQQAIVQHSASAAPLTAAQQVFPQHALSTSPQLAADIFHVPLPG